MRVYHRETILCIKKPLLPKALYPYYNWFTLLIEENGLLSYDYKIFDHIKFNHRRHYQILELNFKSNIMFWFLRRFVFIIYGDVEKLQKDITHFLRVLFMIFRYEVSLYLGFLRLTHSVTLLFVSKQLISSLYKSNVVFVR